MDPASGFQLITMASTRAESSSTNDNVKTALMFLAGFPQDGSKGKRERREDEKILF